MCKMMEGCRLYFRLVFPKYAVTVETYDFKNEQKKTDLNLNGVITLCIDSILIYYT
jgi:hypothetical protein